MTSICVTESQQSRRMLDQHHNWQDAQAQAQAEAQTAHQFTQAIKAGDPDATPAWAGTVTDYEAAKRLGIAFTSPAMPRMAYTVAECLRDALDYTNGPDMGDVLKVLSLAMKSTDQAVSQAARDLVRRAAVKFAEHNTDEVEA